MNRLALLACLILVGCPKASAPVVVNVKDPEPSLRPTKSETGIPEAIASNTPTTDKALDLMGHRVGEMTIDRFSEVVPEQDRHWLPDDKPNERVAFLNTPGYFEDRPLLAGYFTFYGNVLERITLSPKSETDIAFLKSRLTEKYGTPEVPHDGYLVWRDKTSTLVLEPMSVTLNARAVTAKRP